MSEEHQNPDADYYCSLMCTENRVTGNHLPDDQPICNLKDLEIGKCVPSKLEHSQQHDNYVHLVSRVITSEVPCLNFLKDGALPHIPHIYSKEMREKTDTVSIYLNFRSIRPSKCYRRVVLHSLMHSTIFHCRDSFYFESEK